MDGIHDLAGMQGFGKINHIPDDVVFHEEWQRTAFLLMLATQVVIDDLTADEYRHSVERMAPAHYLQSHYYERMLTGTASLMVERGIVRLEELEKIAGGKFPLSLPVAEDPIVPLEPQETARFRPGDNVRVKQMHPKGHVRAPRFCRGKQGIVLHVAPRFSFPDTAAHGGPHRKEHTYHVEFRATDLWNDEGTENNSVVVDLWDSYLEEI